jgi:hypothetical protein
MRGVQHVLVSGPNPEDQKVKAEGLVFYLP